MAQAPKFDTLVSAVEKAETALEKAKADLQGAVETQEEGFVTQVNGVPYHVVIDGEGKKELKCMLTRRQIAAIKGQPIPPMIRRKKANDKEAAKA